MSCSADGSCGTLKPMRLESHRADVGERLDRFIARHLRDTSRSRVVLWIRAGRIQVDGVPERKPSRRLRGGEAIDVNPGAAPPLKAWPEAIDVVVLYEDADLAVIDKAAGMIVHAGAGARSGTLVNALLHRFATLSAVSGETRPGIVHRLDRFTTGVMVVAKRDQAHRGLQDQFQRRTVSKLYWAAVEGHIPADPHDDARLMRHGRAVMRDGIWWLRLEMPIRRDRRNRVKMATSLRGRQAISEVRAVRSGTLATLAEVRLHTGRTHQVRVHLSRAGHPVVGDTLYGARREGIGRTVPSRYLLHSRSLEFTHPRTGQAMRFRAPPPADFQAVLTVLGL